MARLAVPCVPEHQEAEAAAVKVVGSAGGEGGEIGLFQLQGTACPWRKFARTTDATSVVYHMSIFMQTVEAGLLRATAAVGQEGKEAWAGF